ncbi:MAG: hypothetical protein IB618_03015 [Candidatus Pacearchaeota archaeon]|nr:MAG: hypothetical protein IB618_03015 [Candidatus Pacearchaeota archaeon]
MGEIIKFLKIGQDILFHTFNWIIPLLIPAIIVIFLGWYLKSYFIIIPILTSQIYLYDVILLSTNIGLLKSSRKKKDEFKEKNVAVSMCLLPLGLFFLTFSLIISFSLKTYVGNWDILLFILALPFTYSSILLLSKNKLASFVVQSPTELSQNRAKVNKELSYKILRGDKK